MLSAYLLKYPGARRRAIFQERKKAMTKSSARRGFTLLEMLLVIALIAVLVAIIVPAVISSTTKARAAADSANLRSFLGKADVLLTRSYTNEQLLAELGLTVPESESFPEAEMQLVNDFPVFIDIYYVDGSDYYGLDYFGKVMAGADPKTLPHGKPTGPSFAEDNWVTIAPIESE